MQGSKKCVLVVDDNPNQARLMAGTLSEEGYRVVTAESGEEALKTLKLETPGLILLDIIMPGMGGIKTLEAIKSVAPDIPVAMVTGVWEGDERQRAFDAGAYEYVTKPIDLEYLRKAVLIKLFPEECWTETQDRLAAAHRA